MEKKFAIVYYRDPLTGRDPAREWLLGIKDRITRLRIHARILRLEAGNLGDVKSLGDGVFELRIFIGPGYRLYCAHDGKEIILLLLGGDKSTQFQDIRRAKIYWDSYKQGKSR